MWGEKINYLSDLSFLKITLRWRISLEVFQSLRYFMSRKSYLSILKTILKCKKTNILETKMPIWKHMGMLPSYWGANAYIDCRKLSFRLDGVDCRPENARLIVWRVYPSLQWCHLRVMPLESLTNSMEISSIFGNLKSKGCWYPLIFGTLWMNPRKLYL